MAISDVKITQTQPYTYLNRAGSPVQGYKVFFDIVSLNETHYVFVPDLGETTVKTEVMALVNQRKTLDKLTF